jgi:ATP-dependent Lhr-like helicase
LQRTLDRLDGLSAPASAWEADIFPARMSLYDPDWLDLYCISGRVVWGRYSPVTALGAVRKGKSHGAGPVKATPVTLAQRANSRLWQQLASTPTTGEPRERLPLSSVAEKAHQDLQQHGASFFGDIAQRTGLLPAQLEQGLAELVAGGYLSSDSFTGLRALLTPASRRGGGRRRRRASWDVEEAGRWSLLPEVSDVPGTDDENLEALVMIYLKRWGVVCRSVLARETVAPPWRLLLTILKRMELRGTVRGGRFIAGIAGEQFALPDAVTALRDAARRTTEDTSDAYDNAVYHCLSAADPVNLLPVFLPQVRLPRVSRNRVLYCNGVPVAVQEGAEFRLLRDIPAHCHWPLQQLLQRREYAPQLRAYLGNL